MSTTKSTVSEKIRSLYEVYPYPPPEEGMLLDPYLDYMLSLSGEVPKGRPSYLDAGCGTGMVLLGGAQLYPHFDVYGCDFNRSALEHVRSTAQEFGVKNLVDLREVDLLELPQDFGPVEGFDLITLCGVIHHTPDPLAILKSLAGRLAPNGVLRLMVYSERGRSDLYRFARIAKKLFGQGDMSWPEQVSEAQLMMFELHHAGLRIGGAVPCLRGPMEGAHELSDAEFADRYLNPHDVPYTAESLRELVAESGLKFLQWFDPRSWDLGELLPSLSSRGFRPSDPWDEAAMVDELFDRDQFDLYLVGPDFDRQDTAWTPQTLLGSNPKLELTESYYRGFPYKSSSKMLFHGSEDLSLEEAQVLRSVGKTWKCLEDLVQEWEQGDLEFWSPLIDSMLERGQLFRPHPPSSS